MHDKGEKSGVQGIKYETEHNAFAAPHSISDVARINSTQHK